MDDFEKQLYEELDEFLTNAKEELKATRVFDQDRLSTFTNDIAELIKVKNEYEEKRPMLRESAEKGIVKLEYSKGGETIHRGYYCPSPVLDLIVGGAKRGRLYKRKPSLGKYSYEYGFDKDGRLIRAKGVNGLTGPNDFFYEEYLIYRKDIVYGVSFDHSGEIIAVSKCIYDNGNIVKYERSECSIEKYADLHYEEYMYENHVLTEVTVFFNVLPSVGYEEVKYIVEHDDDETSSD